MKGFSRIFCKNTFKFNITLDGYAERTENAPRAKGL